MDQNNCTCLSEKMRREAEETGYVKLVHFEPGYDEDGNPCPVHDPRKKKTMSSGSMEELQAVRKDRGEQLRALVVSWAEDKTFLAVLNEQQRKIEEGKLTLNPEWEQVADEILGGLMSQAKMTWPEEQQESKDDGPKIIIP